MENEIKKLYLEYRKVGDRFYAMLNNGNSVVMDEMEHYMDVMESTLLEIAQNVCDKTGEDWWK